MVKSLPTIAEDRRDAGSIPGSERSPGGGHSNPLQYSRLEKLMDRGAWQATVCRVAKSWTQLKQLSTNIYLQPEYERYFLNVGHIWAGYHKNQGCFNSRFKKQKNMTVNEHDRRFCAIR